MSPRRGFVVKEQTIIHPFVCVCILCCHPFQPPTLLLYLPLDTEWKLYHLYVQRLLMKKNKKLWAAARWRNEDEGAPNRIVVESNIKEKHFSFYNSDPKMGFLSASIFNLTSFHLNEISSSDLLKCYGINVEQQYNIYSHTHMRKVIYGWFKLKKKERKKGKI